MAEIAELDIDELDIGGRVFYSYSLSNILLVVLRLTCINVLMYQIRLNLLADAFWTSRSEHGSSRTCQGPTTVPACHTEALQAADDTDSSNEENDNQSTMTTHRLPCRNLQW